MNDAELVRKAAAELRRWSGIFGTKDAKAYGNETADRLTALADALDGGVIVPREPSDDDLNAIHYALTGEDEGYTNRAYYEGLYRAMLTASEAK